MFKKRRDAVSGRLMGTREERQLAVEAARGFRRAPTKSEAMLWQAVRNGRIACHRFRRQHQIGQYIVDFCCPAKRFVVEIDGPIHDQHTEEDRERQRAIEARGYRFLRVKASDVEHDLGPVIRQIERVIADDVLE
jgi:adenine-specific DNA-methyltransferase